MDQHNRYDKRFVGLIKDFIALGENDHLQGLTARLLLNKALISKCGVHSIKILVYSGVTVEHLDERLYMNIIKDGHLDILQVLLAKCPQNHIDGLNDTQHHSTPPSPLHWAVWYRQLNIICFLVSKGFSVNDRCMNYRSLAPEYHHCRTRCVTPLHYAAELNDLEMTSLLLELGADVYSFTEHVEPAGLPFCVAVEKGNMDLAVNKLLPTDINAPDPTGMRKISHKLGPKYDVFITGTILHYACCTRSVKSVKKLIKLGADQEITADGFYPVQLAIIMGKSDTVSYLFPSSNLKLEHWTQQQLQMAYDKYLCLGAGYSTTLMGDFTPSQPLLRYLVEAGAKPQEPEDLLSALEQHKFGIAGTLLETKCSPNQYVHNGKFGYILWKAMWSGERNVLIEYVMLVLRANPDMTLTRRKVEDGARTLVYENGEVLVVDGTTAMQEALLSKDPEVITLCVESGCCLLNTKPMLDYVRENHRVKNEVSPHIIELLEHYNNTPRSLQHMAKFGVRRCLGHKDVNSKIDQLEIPRHMKCYIKDIGLEAAQLKVVCKRCINLPV